jgi:ATP-dependent DNA helicase MPH1
LDTEVGVSDPSDNEDSDSSGQESESDRRFAGDFQPTQAPAGYDQRRAYLAGLSTQVPNHGPAFAPRAHQHVNFLAKARKPVMLTQEQRAGPSSEYLTDDSFVVDDDVPLEFDSD